MIGNCPNCGAKFKFNEEKVQKLAKVRCPSCKEKILLQQDPNSPDIRFFFSIISSEKNHHALDVDYSRGISEKEQAAFGHKDKTDISDAGRNPQKKRKSTETLELEIDRPKGGFMDPEKKDDAYQGYGEFQPRASSISARSSDDVKAYEERYILKTAQQKKKKRMMLLGLGLGFLFSIVMIASAFLFNASNQEHDDTDSTLNQKARAILDKLHKKYKPNEGERQLHLVKQAEALFGKDTKKSYRKALDKFAKALVMDRQNPELVARYVESYVLAKGVLTNTFLINDLLTLVDYAFQFEESKASLHRARARVYLALENDEKAIEEARYAARIEPENEENRIVLATAQIETNPEQAIETLQYLVSRINIPLNALKPLAQAYIQTGELAKAEDTYKKRDDIDVDSCALCADLANLYQSLGLYKKAYDVLKRYKESRPEMPEAYIRLAKAAWLKTGSPVMSRAILEEYPIELLGALDNEVRNRLLSAKAHFAILDGDKDTAFMAAKGAYELDKEDSLSIYQWVLALIHHKELIPAHREEIEKLIQSLLEKNPLQPEFHLLEAAYYYHSENYPKAVQALTKTVQVDASYFQARLLAAHLLVRASAWDEALEEIRKLFRFSPDYWRNHPDDNFFSDVFYDEKVIFQSLETIEGTRVDLDKRNGALGLAALLMGDKKSAKKYFKMVLKNNRDNVKIGNYLAWMSIEEKKYNVAEKRVKSVLRISRHNTLTNTLLARIYRFKEKLKASRSGMIATAKRKRKSSDLQAELGMLLFKAGKVVDGRHYANLGYQANPHSVLARYAKYMTQR